MNTIIEKIRAEVVRLKKQLVRGACAAQIEMETNCKDEAYNEVLSFLSTLESEKPINQEGLEKEINRYLEPIHTADIQFEPFTQMTKCARHFAQWQKEQMMKEAVEEVEVGMRGEPIEIILDKYVQRAMGIFPGDKVRIIVCKKED